MKKYIIISSLALLLFQCKKSSFNDLSGSQTLKGVVMLYDTLNGMQRIIPAKNYKVYLKYAGNTSGFLYSTTANAQAQFSFNGIDPAFSYTIYASSDTGVVKYAGQNTFTAGTYTDGQSDTLRLYPSMDNQNGIHLLVQDASGGRIGNVTAWVFNSQTLFAADTSAGRVFDMKTNEYGISNLYNIAPGTYYLRVKTKIGNLDFTGQTSVTVPAAGIANATITLSQTPLNTNGIEVNTRDIHGTPLNSARIFAYRSQAIFLADTISFSNSLFTLQSNNAGFAATYLIPPATYFLRAIKVINSDTLTSSGTVIVGPNTVAPINLTLQ